MTGSEITRRPSLRAAVLAGGVGAVGSMATATGGGAPAIVTAAGVSLLTVGIATARQFGIDAGTFVAFVGVVFAAMNGAPTLAVLVGVTATIVAWDAGTNALSLAEQLGREADTIRVEVLHVMTSGAVGIAAAVAGFVLFRLGPTGQPITTLFVLLLGGTLLVLALNR